MRTDSDQTAASGPGSLPLTAEELLVRLDERLLSGEYAAGDKLTSERKLAEQYGVSRPLLREVLGRLQDRGLVTIHPGRGTYVTFAELTDGRTSVHVSARRGQVTPRRLIVARSMLEAQAAELAALHRSEEDLARMRSLLDMLETLPSANDIVEADVAFHEAVAIASDNPVIQIMFGSIRELIRGVVVRRLSDPVVRDEGVPSHRLVLKSIEDRDPAAARSMMIAHLEAMPPARDGLDVGAGPVSAILSLVIVAFVIYLAVSRRSKPASDDGFEKVREVTPPPLRSEKFKRSRSE
ncbi:MAG: lutR4 [Microbacteriaceae bacterium]|jgi:GntR family transcriptional repressor for pyruvate dehydrogenase complex|nr:lutR4 [Microbacteriaceae bacterium]